MSCITGRRRTGEAREEMLGEGVENVLEVLNRVAKVSSRSNAMILIDLEEKK